MANLTHNAVHWQIATPGQNNAVGLFPVVLKRNASYVPVHLNDTKKAVPKVNRI